MNTVQVDILPYIEALGRRFPGARLPPAELSALLHQARLERWRVGARLFHAGAPVEGLLFLLWGSLELDQPDPDGQLRPVGSRQSPDLYGDQALIDGGPQPWGCVATASSLTALLPRALVAPALLRADPLGASLRRLLAASLSASTALANGALSAAGDAGPTLPSLQDRGHLRASQLG